MVYPSFISSMTTAVQVSESWPSISGIRNLVIFGDSYSSVGYRGQGGNKAPRPEQPLGVNFPGHPLEMWNGEGTPNWVGHLLTKYMPAPRFNPDAREQDEGYAKEPLLTYDYAIGGNRVSGVEHQFENLFMGDRGVGTRPEWAPWKSEDTLFVTWIGINDCAYAKKHEQDLSRLFKIQERLYDAGARNFLFVDVPPINRSPAVPEDRADQASGSYDDWNTRLRSGLKPFAESHADASVFLFSSYASFNNLLDNYTDYGFKQDDLHRAFRAIWNDHLHPTSKVHNILASDIYSFLYSIPRKS
ncbi:hypothetical protein BDP27DRAFT_1315709 [Rhodocollybia butyracea]|uniref:Carbohydrate esterase family 16 protein n=1 Tax=Rhodocollybia butyracea TaxID=206335 RepID=A0A9P5Q5N6_9AGAR|nr:hypothetical protein BDP27DRAFT_1315709 [Rhodocollybia butyracea]